MSDANTRLLADLDQAERKAWESLARYKFMMFGYWAGVWVHLNRVGRFGRRNPWASLVRAAREAAPRSSASSAFSAVPGSSPELALGAPFDASRGGAA